MSFSDVLSRGLCPELDRPSVVFLVIDVARTIFRKTANHRDGRSGHDVYNKRIIVARTNIAIHICKQNNILRISFLIKHTEKIFFNVFVDHCSRVSFNKMMQRRHCQIPKARLS
uniref:Uncharacterized protein n=1 Tax=Arundo donax TaxID=35708 RepID=A0A0A9BAC1_ARUDO